MTDKSHAEGPAERNAAWVPFARVLLLVILVILLYLLGSSMVRHRFFRGGEVAPNGRQIVP
jgi:hypothetical protein